MREDLNKLLCERERLRHWDHYSNYRHLKKYEERFDIEQEDDEPFTGVGSGHRESMKHRYGYDDKPFNENLNPLWGFVHKSVGKKWDKVYSEICKVFDKRSVINQHILVHLFQKVETKFIRAGADGKLYYENQYTWRTDQRLVPLKESSIEYYVDPRDGILKYNHSRLTYRQEAQLRRKEREKEEAKIKRVINKETELHKINSSWFEVKFEEREPSKETRWVKNSWDKRERLVTSLVYNYKYDVLKKTSTTDKRVAVSKRQLSSKEIRKYGLE